MEIITTEKEFNETIAQGFVLVDMFATWCGPCKMLAPVLNDLADTYAGKVNIVKVDVDENPELAARFQVMSIPTLLFFKDGNLVETSLGFQSKAALSQKIEALL